MGGACWARIRCVIMLIDAEQICDKSGSLLHLCIHEYSIFRDVLLFILDNIVNVNKSEF